MDSDPQRIVLVGVTTRRQAAAAVLAFGEVVRRRLFLGVGVCAALAAVLLWTDASEQGGVAPFTVVLLCVTTVAVVGMLLAGPLLLPPSAARRAGIGIPVTTTYTPSGLVSDVGAVRGEIGWHRVDRLQRVGGVVAALVAPGPLLLVSPCGALSDADFARLSGWWAAGRTVPAGAPAGAGAGPGAGAAVGTADAVLVSVPLTLPVARRATRFLLGRRSGVLLAVLAALAAVDLGLVLADVAAGGSPSVVGLFPLLLLVSLVALLFEWVPRRTVRRLDGTDMHWRLDAGGFEVRTALGRLQAGWAGTDRVRVTDDVLLVRLRSPQAAYGLPLAGLDADELERVRRWAAAASWQHGR